MSILTGKGHTHKHRKEKKQEKCSHLSFVAVIIEVDSVRSGMDKQPQQHKQVSQQRLITMYLVPLPQLFQNTKYAAHCCFLLFLH